LTLNHPPGSSGLLGADTEDGAVSVDPRHLLAVSRSLHPGRSWASVAQTIYLVALTLGIAGILFWSFWEKVGSFLLDVAGPYQVFWGASGIALVLLGALRYSTLQGFVSYSQADCLFLLTAPVPRSELIRPRLRRVAVALALGGAIIGVLATLTTTGLSAGAVMVVEGAAAGAALGIILLAAGWHVQRLAGLSTWVLRLTLPALGLVVLLALAKRQGGVVQLVALWSGPWGWGLLPLSGSHWAVGLAGLLLLAGLATAGWISVRRTAGDARAENFLERAETRSRVVAGLYAFDARSVVLASRQPWARRWRAHMSLPLPRRPGLAVPWHTSLVLLRSPMRLGWAVLLAGAGALLLAVQPGHTGTSWAGAIALYLSANSLVEPLRLEVDSPGAPAALLPWRLGKVLGLHCLVPVALIIVTGLVSIIIGWAAGFVASSSVPGLLVFVVPTAFTMVFAAALSARRGGRVPQELLLLGAGDVSGLSVFAMIGWIFGWTILAVALVGGVATASLAESRPLGASLAIAGALAVVAIGLWVTLVAPQGWWTRLVRRSQYVQT
jgi:hypothetical protein